MRNVTKYKLPRIIMFIAAIFFFHSQWPARTWFVERPESVAIKMDRDRPLALAKVMSMLDDELPVVESVVKRWILIVTTWRSGSTFTMHLLSSLPATYSHFEPLMEFHFSDLSVGTNRNIAEDMVESLFRCQYNQKRSLFENYLHRKPDHEREFVFKKNERIWNICRQFPASWGYDGLCYDASFLQEACQLFPIQVMKVVRLPLSSAAMLLNKVTDLRVIYLVRDPRATLHSRREMEWCLDQPSCIKPESLCTQLVGDYHLADRLQHQYKDRFTILRYEDLAENPVNTSRKLFNWLGLPWSTTVDQFIAEHGKVSDQNPDSIYRLKGSRIARWIKTESLKDIQHNQNVCAEAMQLFGYLLVNTSSPISEEKIFSLNFDSNYLKSDDRKLL